MAGPSPSLTFISQNQDVLFLNSIISLHFRSNKSLQKYFAALDQSLHGMELVECYGPKFDRTKHGSLFLSKVSIWIFLFCNFIPKRLTDRPVLSMALLVKLSLLPLQNRANSIKNHTAMPKKQGK